MPINTVAKPNDLQTLRGPEWPWQPRSSYSNANGDVAKLSDDLCAGIFKGAVAVHSKTLRLEDLQTSGINPISGRVPVGTDLLR